ncbi:hypothetical protein KCU98_g19107, partial [Aureobasidium melanogenum]
MSWTKKLGVMGILALGTLVVIAAIIRLVYMSHVMHETDITWALGPAQIWTSLEPSLGIVSSCLITTFRPIMSGIRSMFGLKDSGKANKLPSHTEQGYGRGASHKVPRFRGPHEEGLAARTAKVETSVIVEQAPGDEISVAHSRPTNYTTRWTRYIVDLAFGVVTEPQQESQHHMG